MGLGEEQLALPRGLVRYGQSIRPRAASRGLAATEQALEKRCHLGPAVTPVNASTSSQAAAEISANSSCLRSKKEWGAPG